MIEFENNAFFWQKLDTLWFGSSFNQTQGVGDHHLQYSNIVYPVPYGYLKDTTSVNHGIAAFRGSAKGKGIRAIIVATDILNKEVDVKLLIDCTNEEENMILHFLNQLEFQKTIIARRGSDMPVWSETQ
jgi:hypothetical protein